MLVEPQSEIVIKFRDGSFMNCIVDKWTTKESVVYLNDDNREMVVIQDTEKDVMMVRFLNKTYDNKFEEESSKEITKDHNLAARAKAGERIEVSSTEDIMEDRLVPDASVDDIKRSATTDAVKEKFESLKQRPMTLDNLSEMARLKDELNKLEREELLNKFNSHEIGEVKETQYVIPGTTFASPGATQHPAQKVRAKNNAISQQLRQVLSEKYPKNR